MLLSGVDDWSGSSTVLLFPRRAKIDQVCHKSSEFRCAVLRRWLSIACLLSAFQQRAHEAFICIYYRPQSTITILLDVLRSVPF